MSAKIDSKKQSLAEAFVNSFGAFPIGYAIGIIILPFSVSWLQQDPFIANIFITLVYATFSFLRVYLLRRVFARIGIEFNLIKIIISVIKKFETKLGERIGK